MSGVAATAGAVLPNRRGALGALSDFFWRQPKLLVFLLLILCSPLYVMLRFYYGSTFFRMVVLALLLHILALPFVYFILLDQPAFAACARQYSMEYAVALMFLAFYALPVHLLWMFFLWFGSDGRYDPDDPGRPLLPFLHPWLIDLPVAIGLPFAVAALGRAQTYIPVYVPDVLGQDIDGFTVSSGWWFASVVVSAAYVGVALLTAPPPRIRLRRWLLMRKRPSKLRFDPVRLANRPFGREGRREDILG